MYQLMFTTRYLNKFGSCPFICKQEFFDTEHEARERLNGYLEQYKNREDYMKPRYTLFKVEKIDGN